MAPREISFASNIRPLRKLLLIAFILFTDVPLTGQEVSQVTGRLIDFKTRTAISNVQLQLENTNIVVKSNRSGYFLITELAPSQYVLRIVHESYLPKRIEINTINQDILDLGDITLEIDPTYEVKNGALISLTEDDLNDQEFNIDNTAGMLQASKDVFQRRAAFDFSQAYFRPRGYDSKYAEVFINSLSMNHPFNGRPQWSNWGGLNDILKNQELSYGLNSSNLSFGSLLGVTNISIRPSQFRSGTKVSYSFANRTYGGRAMVTHNSGLQKNGFAYSFSASRRWAKEGYIDGTAYDAFSLFGGIEYTFGKNSLGLIAIYSPNTRGSAAAITERVYEALGRKYNPNWGFQVDKIRNARLRTIKEPIFMLNYSFQGEKLAITTNIGYQDGTRGTSRLDFINAPNPYPNYWRYLGSIVDAPQIDWSKLYDANQSVLNVRFPGAAHYLMYQDRTQDKLLSANTLINIKLGNRLSVDAGASFSRLLSENYAIPLDLLGAAYYRDVNPFNLLNGQPTRNDLNGQIDKGIDDRIKYSYSLLSSQINGFFQLHLELKKLSFFFSSRYRVHSYQREGHFLNESFLENSLGKSSPLEFSNMGFKAGLLFKISGRHLFSLNGMLVSNPPTIRNSFINVRENNLPINNLKNELISALEANYIFRTPKVKGRLSGYYSSADNGTGLNFIFAQIGSGTDFFQEVVTEIQKRHLGVEVGLELQLSPTTKLTAAAAHGAHQFAGNPRVTVNFDTVGLNNGRINDLGFKDLGFADMKNLYLANGPQQVYSLGLEYKDPNYWWIGATTNYLSHSFVDPASIRRTNDFFKDPNNPSGDPIDTVNQNVANKLLEQEKFKSFYLLNINGGKSFPLKSNYLSLFFSINNLFESEFKTGGYEQARTSTYESLVADMANGSSERNFGNKYWFGHGRTFFANIAYTF